MDMRSSSIYHFEVFVPLNSFCCQMGEKMETTIFGRFL